MEPILVHPPTAELEKRLRGEYGDRCQIHRVEGKLSLSEALARSAASVLMVSHDALCEGDDGPEEALKRLQRDHAQLTVVILLPPGEEERAPELVRAGAAEVLSWPCPDGPLRTMLARLRETVRMRRELGYLRDRSWSEEPLEVLESRCPAMQRVLAQIQSVAPTRTTVLLTGDSGTGKSLLARLLHSRGHRRDRPFVNVHCGALPESLVESELFGHERGAFTGADRRRLGKFELAHRGTLFLDEIGTITASSQIKLLQVLQERCFSRLGGSERIEVDVRIIAATNADLEDEVRQGRFRQDLYYRLAVFPIHIPPLRERREDIPLLARSFLRRLRGLYGREIHEIQSAVDEALQNYPWPGNVRELENVLERAYVLERSHQLTLASLPPDVSLRRADDASPMVLPSRPMELTLAEGRTRCIDGFERQYLTAVLARNHGRIDRSATEAGISVRQLHKLLSRHGIRKEDFKVRRGRPSPAADASRGADGSPDGRSTGS